MHIIGVQGMPRRVSDYDPQFGTWNMVISISSFFLGASFIVFLYNMIIELDARAARPGRTRGAR